MIDFLRRVKYHVKDFFVTNDYWKAKVEKKYNLAKGFPVVDINDVFPDFNADIEMSTFSFSNSLFTDYGIIKLFCGKFENCNYFEIGTWKGESVANAAAASQKAFTLNLPDDEVRKFKLPEDYLNLIGHFSKDLPNVIHLKGNSLHYDFSSLNQKFDVVFIDGDHHYKLVKNDTEKVFKHLIHENSIVIWHDYAFNPEKIRYEVFLGILDGLPKEKHKDIYHISDASVAVYMKGSSYNTSVLKAYKTPNKKFKINIKSSPI